MKTLALPPLKALLAFEAAATSGSFASAAAELFITPAAVSQQIRNLEEQLDIRLFERAKTGVTLTRAGQSYLQFINEGLGSIRQGQQQLTQFRQTEVITIAALPSVASKWLMPRAMRFMELNPGLEIRVVASHETVDFNRSATDLCISFGHQQYSGLHTEQLFTDSVSLVASPQLLSAMPQDLAELTSLPVIHIDWGDDNHYLPGWHDWQESSGIKLNLNGGPRFNLSSMAIDAAVQGKGLLLGQQGLITAELSARLLQTITDISLPLGLPYYLTYPSRTLDNPMAKAFISWLPEQVGSTYPQIPGISL